MRWNKTAFTSKLSTAYNKQMIEYSIKKKNCAGLPVYKTDGKTIISEVSMNFTTCFIYIVGLSLGKAVQVILQYLAINGGFNIPIKHTVISKEVNR